MGAFWHQLTFTAHDAGHLGITHSYRIDSYIGIFIANLLGGISIGWWKYHHNIHHLVTNSPEHDPGELLIPYIIRHGRCRFMQFLCKRTKRYLGILTLP
jgi:delta8-fatty-acid desaturase